MSKKLEPLSPDAIAAIDKKIEETEGLAPAHYLPTSQSGEACFHYPAWDTLPPFIELPGSCDLTITGFSGFNAFQVSSQNHT